MFQFSARRVPAATALQFPGDFVCCDGRETPIPYRRIGVVFQLLCPCGCLERHRLTVNNELKPDDTIISHWTWDGDSERPTITPSFRVWGHAPYEMGLTSGVFTGNFLADDAIAEFRRQHPGLAALHHIDELIQQG